MSKLTASLGFVRAVSNWPAHYAAAHGLRRSDRLTYVLRNGLRFQARPRTLDVAMLKEVFVDRLYTPPGWEIGPGNVVFDVGAHIGLFSALAARSAGGVRVFAFEPAPGNFELLQANIGLNGLGNVTASREAVSRECGEKELRLSRHNPGGHSFHFVEESQDTITVPTVSLAEVVRRHGLHQIDFLKLDCEGEEYEILEGCPGELLERVRKISMEYHELDEPRRGRRLQALLGRHGFTVTIAPKPDATGMLWAARDAARRSL